MKAYQPTDLGRSVVRFFQDYLPTLRGMSRHTIQSYRDAMILFLGFCAEDRQRRIERLELSDITADRVVRVSGAPGGSTQEQRHDTERPLGRHPYVCTFPGR